MTHRSRVLKSPLDSAGNLIKKQQRGKVFILHFSVFALSRMKTRPTCLFYLPQHFLYFFPLPHGQGSLRPTFFSAIFGFAGFNNLSKSVISSGLSGSNPIVYFQSFSSNIDATSFNLSSVCTLTTAGLFSVPNFPVF